MYKVTLMAGYYRDSVELIYKTYDNVQALINAVCDGANESITFKIEKTDETEAVEE